MSAIEYKIGNNLELETVIELYRKSTLGERRPVDNRSVMESMIRNANLVVTAWSEGTLVGIARSVTDFAYVAYLADLAVHQDYQHRGIGTELIAQTRDALKSTCFLTLLSAPKANEFYPKIGFDSHPRAWVMEPRQDPKVHESQS